MRTHRPTFPQYPLKKDEKGNIQWKTQTLAWIEKGRIIDEHGTVYRIDDFTDLHYYAFRYNLLLFTRSVTAEHFQGILDYAVRDTAHAKVCCSQIGIPFSIRLSNENRTSWLVTMDTWKLEPTYESLERLKKIFAYFGCGTTHTPASLGRNSMMYVYDLNNLTKQSSPSLAVENYLREHAVGGIVQTPQGEGVQCEETTQLDMASAYLSQYRKHPTGGAIYFGECEPEECATYFGRCRVTVNRQLPIGPFPYRRGDNRFCVEYPVRPSTYETYLWKEQVEDCRNVGCKVDVLDGYYWRYWTTHNYPWSQYAYFKRKQALKEIEGDVKGITNGAMGKFGSHRELYYLISGDGLADKRNIVRGVTENHHPINYFVRQEINYSVPIMLHWYYYTIMQTNRVVYLFALPFAQQGRLVWMDYDSVMVIESDPVKGMYLKKYDPRTLFIQPGTWIWSLWYNITIAHKGSRSFKGTREDGTFVDHSPGYHEKEVA